MGLKINKAQIASVKVNYPEKINTYSQWTEPGRDSLLFGLITIREWEGGYYSEFFRDYLNKEDWEKDGYFEPEPKGGLYNKPNVVLTMSSGRKIKKVFESSYDMGFWISDYLKGIELIEIN